MILDGDHQRAWKDGEKRDSKLVFIGRQLPEEKIRKGFETVVAWSNNSSGLILRSIAKRCVSKDGNIGGRPILRDARKSALLRMRGR